MAGFNQATLVGNVGRDPEIRTTQSGVKIAAFSIATSESWKDAAGQKQERTEWHNIVVWGTSSGDGLAGIVEKFVKKGSKLLVQGQLRTRNWEKDGVTRYTTEVVLSGFAAQLQLLDSAGGRAPKPESPDEYSGGAGRPQRALSEEMDDEIPF
jgi:single-strand DNA-binding protein